MRTSTPVFALPSKPCRTTCGKGHAYADSGYLSRQHNPKKTYLRCRQCDAVNQRIYRERFKVRAQ